MLSKSSSHQRIVMQLHKLQKENKKERARQVLYWQRLLHLQMYIPGQEDQLSPQRDNVRE
jgi:hypothetical protein